MMYNYLKQGNHLGNISGVLKIHLISGMVARGSLCHPHQRVGLLTSYSSTGRHYITINGKMIVQSFSQATTNPTLKIKGKVTLPPMSISVVEIKNTMGSE